MSEAVGWLEALTEDTLIVQRVADNATVATYQPCRATLLQAHRRLDQPLAEYARTLAYFDDSAGLVKTYPLKTRAASEFLERKYWWLSSIDFEIDDLKSPEDPEQAVDIFEQLPDGFVKDWKWGLGIHKLFKPIVDVVSSVDRPDTTSGKSSETLLISTRLGSHISKSGYVLNIRDYNNIRTSLNRIQTQHQKDALTERAMLTHDPRILKKEQDYSTFGLQTC